MNPKTGDYVIPDDWDVGEVLQAEDNWDRAQFRLPIWCGPIKSIACNVTITGGFPRLNSRTSAPAWRCRIDFPGDGEPDTATHGWIVPGGIA